MTPAHQEQESRAEGGGRTPGANFLTVLAPGSTDLGKGRLRAMLQLLPSRFPVLQPDSFLLFYQVSTQLGQLPKGWDQKKSFPTLDPSWPLPLPTEQIRFTP